MLREGGAELQARLKVEHWTTSSASMPCRRPLQILRTRIALDVPHLRCDHHGKSNWQRQIIREGQKHLKKMRALGLAPPVPEDNKKNRCPRSAMRTRLASRRTGSSNGRLVLQGKSVLNEMCQQGLDCDVQSREARE